MVSPYPEGALENETAAEPGAHAGEPRGGDDEEIRDLAGEPREPAVRPAEGRGDALRIAGGPCRENDVTGQDGAPHRGADTLAREVAREAGGVADQHEAPAGEPAGTVTADRIGMAAERRERQIEGEAARSAQAGEQPVEPGADRRAAERADPDVLEDPLWEGP